LVVERNDTDAFQPFTNLFRIAAKIIVIAEAKPSPSRSARQGREGTEKWPQFT
jgi:hypothetical protein